MKKKEQKPVKEERFIRIDAQSEIFSVKEDVPESKATKRLTKIRELFILANNKHGYTYPNAKLKVKTWVLNPELPFAAQR